MSASSSTFRPVSLPSRVAQIVMSWIWSRPWCAAVIDSDRDSVHFTGLPSLRATSRAMNSSGITASLPPKPPPTSGAMTRSWCSGMPSVSAAIVLVMCGICVADHMVSCGAVGSTTTERGSMNAGMSRCWRNRLRSTTSESVMARSTSSPEPASAESNVHTALRLVPRSGCTSGASSAIAFSSPRTTGSSS